MGRRPQGWWQRAHHKPSDAGALRECGRYAGGASLPNVNHALGELSGLIKKEKLASVALPRLATGVGGLDWAAVRPLIEKHLEPLGIPVIVYTTYRKGVPADEGLETAERE